MSEMPLNRNSLVDRFCRSVEGALRAEKERIGREIRAYPPPIPACDTQFNCLLEQRNTVNQELNAMRNVIQNDCGEEVKLASLIDLVDRSKILDVDAKQRLRSSTPTERV